MVEKLEGYNTGVLSRSITRRQAIKAGGIAAVGLAFSKPLIDTVMPKPAFANYVTIRQGKPSIDWRPDDIESDTSPVNVLLCNVSDDDPVTINNWMMRFEILESTGVTGVTINGQPISETLALLPGGTIASLTSPPDACANVSVGVQGTTFKLKVRVFAVGIDTFGQETPERQLTVTIND